MYLVKVEGVYLFTWLRQKVCMYLVKVGGVYMYLVKVGGVYVPG